MIYQIAKADDTYCKQVAAELKVAQIDRDKASIEFLWDKFFKDQYQKTSTRGICLIFDGLDEADASGRVTFLNLLADVPQNELQIQLLLLGRPELDVDLSLIDGVQPSVIRVSSTKNAEDIERFINKQYNQSARLTKFPEDVREEVVTTLTQNARGMFLYVDMMLKELATKTQAAEVRAALKSLPAGLVGVFEQVLDRIANSVGSEEAESLKTLLCWVTYAERPLSLNEASSTIDIKTGCGGFSVNAEVEDRCAR